MPSIEFQLTSTAYEFSAAALSLPMPSLPQLQGPIRPQHNGIEQQQVTSQQNESD
jgi:hypothetical protein